jgi:hypothetical protein
MPVCWPCTTMEEMSALRFPQQTWWWRLRSTLATWTGSPVRGPRRVRTYLDVSCARVRRGHEATKGKRVEGDEHQVVRLSFQVATLDLEATQLDSREGPLSLRESCATSR